MPLVYQKIISREDLQANPNALYIFGDNMVGRGYGGQAGAMRGEPNAIGIPTKNLPSQMPDAFFTDADFEDWWKRVELIFLQLESNLRDGTLVVWPLDDIGTGLSELPERSPRIWAKLQEYKNKFSIEYKLTDW